MVAAGRIALVVTSLLTLSCSDGSVPTAAANNDLSASAPSAGNVQASAIGFEVVHNKLECSSGECTAQTVCPVGKHVTGGGYTITSSGVASKWVVTGSIPITAPTGTKYIGWEARAMPIPGFAASSITLRVYAVCES
jgi:hypothetical protein